jgi:hypothetical protein
MYLRNKLFVNILTHLVEPGEMKMRKSLHSAISFFRWERLVQKATCIKLKLSSFLFNCSFCFYCLVDNVGWQAGKQAVSFLGFRVSAKSLNTQTQSRDCQSNRGLLQETTNFQRKKQ